MSYRMVEAPQYWIDKLENCVIERYLMADFVRSPYYQSATYHFAIDDVLRQRMMHMANGNPIAAFVIFLSCFKIMLYKISGKPDVVVVTPAYQDEKLAHGLVILRDMLHQQMTGKDVITAVNQTIIHGYQHQEYLIAQAPPAVQSCYKPSSYQVLLAEKEMHHYLHSDAFDDMKNDIKVFIDHRNDKLNCKVVYNESLFTKCSITAIVNSFIHIMDHTVHHVHNPIIDISLISEAKRDDITTRFNNTTTVSQMLTLDQMVEAQAKKEPDGMALSLLSSEGIIEQSVTYHQLMAQASTIVQLLNRHGAKKQDIIAIIGEWAIETVIGMLGVLKFGATFLLVMPSLSEEERTTLLTSSQVCLVVDPYRPLMPTPEIASVIDATPISGSSLRSQSHHTVDNIAYIMYTAGSMGHPKGVLVEHQSVVNTVTWRQRWYAASRDDTVVHVPSFLFNNVTEDIFTALGSGAHLLLPKEPACVDATYIQKVIHSHKVTHVRITPGYYRQLLTYLSTELPSLRSVTLTGEHVSADLVTQHFECLPNVALHNEYGSIETSVSSTVYQFSPTTLDVSIGRPIDNMRCYIVNHEGHIMPVGIPGELCIAGVGLARGYLNETDLTRHVFKPSAYISEDRLCWTGDSAKWLDNGTMIFLGRQSEQVHVASVRYNRCAIETNMREMPEVTDAVVMTPAPDDSSMYGFFTASAAITPSTLNNYLSQRLPYSLIPTHLVQLEHIPMTLHGKVDRNHLRELAVKALVANPQRDVEQRLVELWSECLRIDPGDISVTADFFDLDGRSLTAVVLVERIEDEFRCQVPLAKLIEYSTIRQMADYLHTILDLSEHPPKGTTHHGD